MNSPDQEVANDVQTLQLDMRHYAGVLEYREYLLNQRVRDASGERVGGGREF